MKRSSSSLDQSSSENDEKLNKISSTKTFRHANNRYSQQTFMDQCFDNKMIPWTPHNSSIITYTPPSSTYVLSFVDQHLTWTQSVQVCSVLGRVCIHGYVLRPFQFYSIHNYRTNRPLTMELLPPLKKLVVSPEIQALLDEYGISERVLNEIEQKDGDLVLIRKYPTENSLFLQTMRDNQMFSQWFTEKYSFFESQTSWRQLEHDLHIRLIEPDAQSVVLPSDQFTTAADRIIRRWKNETSESSPYVVLVAGEKDTGKSTFTRYLVNRAMDQLDSNLAVTYFDCDIGQCEFTMSGCLSYVHLDAPVFGPPCSHIRSNIKPDRLLFYGHLSPQQEPVRYLEYVNQLRKLWNIDHKKSAPKRSLLIINTMGWGTGLGLTLLTEIICMCCPDTIVKLDSPSSTMPNLTLAWLAEQPVFLPYRNKIQLNDRRTRDYDGQLDYEHFKLHSTASPTTKDKEQPQLRARDHRLLATWSYFFSSQLSRIYLSWSSIIHVSLVNNKIPFPNVLEHSLVALCYTDQIEQFNQSVVSMNGVLQLINYENVYFECLGFGWVERCNQQSRSYEIYTPITDQTKINLLVLGTFDTPQEFQTVFKSFSI